jgi:hypothetical protein
MNDSVISEEIQALDKLAEFFLLTVSKTGIHQLEEAFDEKLMVAIEACGEFYPLKVHGLFAMLERVALLKMQILTESFTEALINPESNEVLPEAFVMFSKHLKEINATQAKEESARKARAAKPDAKAKMAFQEWAKKTINPDKHSGKIQINDVRGMDGFDPSWEQNDKTLKDWLKETFKGFSLKRGAKKRNSHLVSK